MSKMHLHQSLTNLHKEITALKDTREIDSDAAHVLHTLTQNIQNVLEHPGEAVVEHHYTLLDNLKEAVGYFEVSHPKLNGLINSVINSLNALGI